MHDWLGVVLRYVTNSGRRTITVDPYNPEWAAEFEKIRSELSALLGETALAVEHVGSTAVEGLWAKPIIDIDVVISGGDFEKARALLAAGGYEHEGDLGIAGREAFGYADKPHLMQHHLYVCAEGAAELRRHLALRDYLRENADARERYGAIKREMAARHPHDIDAYIEGKGPVIAEIYEELGV
ncbi:MAG: GrpB family protein [Oscillospiraceae bacterium]|nr:GrpB family protein [Oscillospiraceae bacterium]